MAAADSVENDKRPASTLLATRESSPGSKIGIFPLLQPRDLRGVLVDAGYDMPEIGKTSPGHEPHIAGTDHRYPHERNLPTSFMRDGCGVPARPGSQPCPPPPSPSPMCRSSSCVASQAWLAPCRRESRLRAVDDISLRTKELGEVGAIPPGYAGGERHFPRPDSHRCPPPVSTQLAVIRCARQGAMRARTHKRAKPAHPAANRSRGQGRSTLRTAMPVPAQCRNCRGARLRRARADPSR